MKSRDLSIESRTVDYKFLDLTLPLRWFVGDCEGGFLPELLTEDSGCVLVSTIIPWFSSMYSGIDIYCFKLGRTPLNGFSADFN